MRSEGSVAHRLLERQKQLPRSILRERGFPSSPKIGSTAWSHREKVTMTAFPARSKRFGPRMRGILQRTRPPANNARATAPLGSCGYPDICAFPGRTTTRSEEHTSELQSRLHLVCRLLLEKKKKNTSQIE